VSLVDRVAGVLETRLPRRSFVNRAAMVGSAVAVGKGLELLLEPGTAYARVCGCNGQSCDCGSRCCTGYTDFCCTVSGGSNYCPSNTIVGGWWKADTSSYCSGGPRYFMDCNATCSCSDGAAFCSPECDTTDCGCANGDCNSWRTGCVQFRYGQCNQDVETIGRIVCRMVTCVPPWEIDPTCTTASARDNATAEHSVPCWSPDPCRTPLTRCEVAAMAATTTGQGYGLVTSFGKVFMYGDAVHAGDLDGQALIAPIVGLAFTPGGGYYLVAADGGVFTFGGALFRGSIGGHVLNQPIVGMALTVTGLGYWLVASDGGMFTFGDARFYGSLGALQLNQPIVGMARTPSGRGYWLVARDGGIFTFGDAPFFGSATEDVTSPVVGIASRRVASSAAVARNGGYWIATRDGGVFSFGAATYAGAAVDTEAAGRVVAIAPDGDGEGYWLVSEEGVVVSLAATDHGSPVDDRT
jgi:hypothetical protein